ncbi:MAG: methionine--tRNA ligase [Acidobacteria bacterium]|nr:methionine--tRNA ligase [Acidobacteriota bacterium]
MKKFYLTTPLYYPSARLHAGHAYTTLVCDALARYKRLCGYDVAFLTGTDEHGEKLERAAVAAGMTPQDFVATERARIRQLWKLLNIGYTHFVYTDQPEHTISVQRMLLRAQAAGYVYKGHYQGRYCVFDERYIADGTEPADCDICGRPAELISEENYFFRLSAFQDRLLEHYATHPEFVQPDFRRNEVVSFVKSGLRDISISRKRIKWGIPWPDDPEQVFYVWYDALTGYMTGIGYAEGENGSREFQKYWPADCHMIGKDIVRFHAVYWPAFLMAAEMPLPGSVVAHGWLLVDRDKMSKSKGNAVYVEPVEELFRSGTNAMVAGSDALRYYILREIPFGQDASISYEALLQRYNSDLANGLGNLANRTVAMLNQYFGGEVPSLPLGGETEAEKGIARLAAATLVSFRARFDTYDFSRGLEAVWQFIARLNKYLVETEPWALAEADPHASKPRLAAILYTAAEAVRFTTVMLAPVLPQSSERLWKQLGGEGKLENQRLDELRWGGLKSGTRLAPPEIIFRRLDKTPSLRKLGELAAVGPSGSKPEKEKTKRVESQSHPESQPQAVPKISIEDFAKVEMRVGEILTAEPVQGAQKLLKLTVNIGEEVRQVVAGIAEYYKPEEIVGMKVVLVTNLQPRKLRGVESNGMIVAATLGEEGRPVLVTFKEDVPNGARLK